MRIDRLLRLTRKLRGRSAEELLTRAKQVISIVAERGGWTADVAPIGDAGLLRALRTDLRRNAGTAETARQAWLDRPALLPAWRDLDIEALHQRWPEHVREILARADAVRRGRADLLGYDQLDVGRPPDWHRDAVSGLRAPLVHWSKVPFLDPSIVGDHKVTWELNRQQGSLALAQAYRLTDDASYATDAWTLIEHWMEHNPPKLGINWASSLEQAFRVIAWTWCANLLRAAPPAAPQFGRLLDVLARHGRHLERHLSTWFAPNTHLTGEALGLYCLGTAWPELADAPRWRDLGESILREEFARQIHPDGVYYERTAWYHRYVMDFLLVAHELALASDRPAAAKDFAGHLARCGSVLDALMAPSGDLPLLGDDDGGLLMVLGRRPTTDARPSLHATAIVLGDAALARRAGTAVPESSWLLGSLRALHGLEVNTTSALNPKSEFPDGGWYILRDRHDKAGTLALLDAGQLGPSRTGRVHSHASSLALEVCVHGVPLLTDRGTASYSDASLRQTFRAAASHNTVTIDGRGASQPGGAFGWIDVADVALAHKQTERVRSVAAEARGFGPHHAHHRRAVLQLPLQGWIVLDEVMAVGSHTVRGHWHAAPGADVQIVTARNARIALGGVELAVVCAGDGGLAVHPAGHSPVYGKLVGAQEVQYLSKFEDKTSWVTLLAYRDHDAVHIQRTAHGWDVRLGSTDIRVTAGTAGDAFTISPES